MGESLIALAVKAQLPMISVTTTDRVNLNEIVEHLAGRKITTAKVNPKAIPKGALFVGPDNLVMPVSMYPAMVEAEATYVGVNFKKVPQHFFDAGEMPVPHDMLAALLKAGLSDQGLVDTSLPCLGGLTLAQAVDVVRLTMARDHSLTPAGIATTRHAIIKDTRGLTLIDTSSESYLPPKQLADFVAREKAYFLKGTDHRLMPRGILVAGPPGVGKTAGAMYIARQWGVPAYRLDLGTVQEKWVGSSEAHMAAALARLEATAPCVGILDELEKMVAGHDSESTGIGGNLLGQLLWWQQEHRSRVFTYMTTNNIKRIPPELFREGRIDETMTFTGLKTAAEMSQFIEHVMGQFPKLMRVPVDSVKVDMKLGKNFATQAEVSLAVYRAIKCSSKAAPN